MITIAYILLSVTEHAEELIKKNEKNNIAEFTMNKLLMMDRGTVRNM
jgi:hypothetical protein